MKRSPVKPALPTPQSPAPRHQEPWTHTEDRLLFSGNLSDAEIARLIDRTPQAVRQRRILKGIFHRAANRPWTEAELALVGTLPDHKVAALTGRTLAAIQTRRITVLGLPCVSGHGREWKPEEDQLMGKYADGVMAKRFNCAMATVARRPHTRNWTATEEKLLGTDSDRQIARKLGRTTKSVGHHRRELGIPVRRIDREETAQLRRELWAKRKQQFGYCLVDPNDKPWTPE